MREQQTHNQEVLRKVFNLDIYPLDVLFYSGKLKHCADSELWKYRPIISEFTADYFENIHLHPIKQPHYPVCEAP